MHSGNRTRNQKIIKKIKNIELLRSSFTASVNITGTYANKYTLSPETSPSKTTSQGH